MDKKSDLVYLLKHISPCLHTDAYVFISVQTIADIPFSEVLAFFRESEGVTVVIKQALADQLGLPYNFTAGWISLEVESSLDAVGLTAAFSTLLAKAGISCNVIAGYYHDHIFVPFDKRKKAINCLQNIT